MKNEPKIIQIISTHKRARGKMSGTRYIPAKPIGRGMKRVEAIIQHYGGRPYTAHIDIPK